MPNMARRISAGNGGRSGVPEDDVLRGDRELLGAAGERLAREREP